MENGQSFIDYLICKYPELDAKLLLKLSVFEKSDEYLRLLHESIIVEETVATHEDYNYRYHLFEANSHVELVDSVIAHLIRENSLNTLVNGYHDPSSNSVWGSKIFNPYVSFQVNFLKNESWNRLFNRIGKIRFLNLVLTTKCFIKISDVNYMQLFGLLPSFKSKISELLLKSRMLYKNQTKVINSLRFFSDEPLDLIEDIVPRETFKYRRNLPKKFRPLKRLCNQIIHNDSKCNYSSIYKEICTSFQPKTIKTNFDYVTEISVVIRFVLIVTGKIFPLNTWGTPKNKSEVIKKIVRFIKAGKNDKFLKDQLISSIQLSHIYWLGKTSEITSKQDYKLRVSLFSSFMEWFLSVYICKLVGSFWYVTEVSHGILSKDILHYPHNEWKRITNKWLNDYVKNYLVETTVSVEFNETSAFKKYNIGRLRLLPKSNDFRALCIPIKQIIGSNNLNKKEKETQKFQYLNHMNNNIRPIRELLLQKERDKLRLDKKSHPRCFSLRDIAHNICLFKHDLINKYTHIPKLFMLKFDMKHCFDNVSQDRILKSVEELFAEDSSDKVYYIRQFVESSVFKQELKKQRYVIKNESNVQEYNILEGQCSNFQFNRSPKIIVDKAKTFRFRKSQVLETVREHVFHSTMVLPNNTEKYFRRTKGVFQGLPLLATLCNLVYNSLVDENFQFLLNDNSDSILLRLVDDFLVISTDRSQCQKVYDIVLGQEFQSSGAFVNTSKTYWAETTMDLEDSIKFVGLKINPSTLEILPDADSNSSFISLSKYKSFKSVYLYLQWCYKVRLADHFIKLELVSFKAALKNIAIILNAIIESYYVHFKEILMRLGEFDEQPFQEFLLSLLHMTLRKYQLVNPNKAGMEEISTMFRKVIISKLSKNSVFQNTNSWLENSRML